MKVILCEHPVKGPLGNIGIVEGKGKWKVLRELAYGWELVCHERKEYLYLLCQLVERGWFGVVVVHCREKEEPQTAYGLFPSEEAEAGMNNLIVQARRGRMNIVDYMVRCWTIGNGEESQVADTDGKQLHPNLVAELREAIESVTVTEQVLLAAARYYSGSTVSPCVLELLLPYISNRELYDKDFEAWEKQVLETWS